MCVYYMYICNSTYINTVLTFLDLNSTFFSIREAKYSKNQSEIFIFWSFMIFIDLLLFYSNDVDIMPRIMETMEIRL